MITLCSEAGKGSHLDLNRAPYIWYGVKYIDLVSLVHFPFRLLQRGRQGRSNLDRGGRRHVGGGARQTAGHDPAAPGDSDHGQDGNTVRT